MRLRDISRILTKLGMEVTPPRGGGSHYRVQIPDGRPIVIPAHNGEKTDISDFYVRQLCRALGMEVEEFKSQK